MLGFIVEYTTRLQRYAQPIPGGRILRRQLYGSTGKVFGVSKATGIVSTGARLHQYHAQRNQRIHICRTPKGGIAVSHFRLFPALLIGINIAEPVSRATILGVNFQYALVGTLGFSKPLRVAKLVSFVQQVFNLVL